MAGVAPDSRGSAASVRGGALRRADAVASRGRILETATALAGDRRVSMAQIAAAAGGGRSTLSRHFPTRQALEQALEERGSGAAAESAGSASVTTMPYQAPGQLGRD